MSITVKGWPRAVFLGACLLAANIWNVTAHAEFRRHLTLPEMVNKSDVIFTATCTKKETVLHNGNIVTRYKLKPDDVWKGSLDLNKAGELAMEERGGSLQEPLPMTQFSQGMANMEEGEDVLLFTTGKRLDLDRAALGLGEPSVSPDTLRIVGRNYGRLTVFRHPETGERLVSHLGVRPQPGSAKNPLMNSLQQIEKQEKSLQERITAGEVTREDVSLDRRKRFISKFLDKTHTRALAARERTAEQYPSRQQDIVNFESLPDIKSRVLLIMQEAQGKDGKK